MRRFVLAIGVLASAQAHAQTAAPGAAASAGVQAEQPWARATAPRQTVAGIYVTLTSPVDDRLLGVTSSLPGRVEVHATTMDGGVARMRELADGLALPAGQPVALAPGGIHIMVMDLQEPLKMGEEVHLNLRFQHAPPLHLSVPVASIGARGPGAPAPSTHKHQH